MSGWFVPNDHVRGASRPDLNFISFEFLNPDHLATIPHLSRANIRRADVTMV